jgi:lysophospholipase L1-like esterase
MDEVKTLTFVALGDSLTYGFVSYGFIGGFGAGLPYTNILDNLVVAEAGRRGLDVDVVFVNRGVNGDTVQGMLGRLEAEVAGADYVIVWGGINDLYGGRSPGYVAEVLGGIYGEARKLGVEPVGCTITSVTRREPIVELIREANGLIRLVCVEMDVRLVDLFGATSDEEGLLLEELSSDGVHLSGEGNRVVAETVFRDAVEGVLDRL